MHPNIKGKTTFMTNGLSYCYKVMPFGLKKVRVTYQRLIDKIFTNQISRNGEAYVDDMVAKIRPWETTART